MKLPPLIYIFEMLDIILFLVKNLKSLTSNFNTNNYISFFTSADGIKLRHNVSSMNIMLLGCTFSSRQSTLTSVPVAPAYPKIS